MLQLAIIGLGAVTRNIHLPAYRRLSDRLRVIAGCDVDPISRAWARSVVPIVYENAEAMLEAEKPDLVAVCTPPALHREHCLLALDHGCHVFCEKPLAESVTDAVEIIRASERAGRRVVVNTQFAYMRMYEAARAKIDSPDFGRLLFMHAWQTFRRTEDTEAGWRSRTERRVCLEFGVHVFDLARFFFGENPTSVMAHMPRPLPGERADVVNTIALEYPGGRGAAIVLNRLSQGPHRYLDLSLDGESGSIHTSIGGELRLEAGIRTPGRRPYVSFHFAKGGKAILHRGDRKTLLAREEHNPFAAATARHLGQYIDALRADVRPSRDVRDHFHTLALAEAAYESAASGRSIDLREYVRQFELPAGTWKAVE